MTAQRATDWKAVADEMYMLSVGLMTGSASVSGRSVEAASARARRIYDGSVRANTSRRIVHELSSSDARSLSRSWEAVRDWIYRHAELCEEPADLRRLERSAGRVSDLISSLRGGAR